jgi:hypothetical protein
MSIVLEWQPSLPAVTTVILLTVEAKALYTSKPNDEWPNTLYNPVAH